MIWGQIGLVEKYSAVNRLSKKNDLAVNQEKNKK